MGLKADLESQVAKIFGDQWNHPDGQKVPEPTDLKLDSNDARVLDATVLYADMASSTDLVDSRKAHFAAEVYKAYLRCAAKIIQNRGGTITAYDGDRVMGVFIGDGKCSAAARAALELNWAVTNIVNVKLKAQYPQETYTLKHVVGIDTSQLWVARTGVRADNDLVWVGRAANYGAKLCALNGKHSTYITDDVFRKLNDGSKYSNGTLMWDKLTWTARNNATIYGSTYWWSLA
jgi:class 3 adenylate cyclase